MAGKLHPRLLKNIVYKSLGVDDPDVIVGPAIGEDAAVVSLGNGRVLVVHPDPITGSEELLGWLSIHIPCNDIAVTGARPRWLVTTLLLPEDYGEDSIRKIFNDMDNAAREVGVSIIGGHTEYTAGIDRPLVSVTAIGITDQDSFVATRNARPGDLVLMTKFAGLEATAVLASDFADELLEKGIDESIISSARRYAREVSVVREALLLAEKKLVNSMHDPTEGGIIGGLAEIAYASNTSIIAYASKIPVTRETIILSRAMGVDPLRSLGSGSLLATVSPNKAGEALRTLESIGVKATIIGEVVEKDECLVRLVSDKEETCISDVYVVDDIMRLWEEKA